MQKNAVKFSPIRAAPRMDGYQQVNLTLATWQTTNFK
jgi:hypothetical protein